MMSPDELAAIDVRAMLNKRAAVFIWATCPRLDFAFELIDAWKLHYRGVAYVWVKINRRGEIIAGQGVPPTFTKPTSELLLVATTNPTGRPFPILDLAQSQVVLHHARRPQREAGDFPDADRTASAGRAAVSSSSPARGQRVGTPGARRAPSRAQTSRNRAARALGGMEKRKK